MRVKLMLSVAVVLAIPVPSGAAACDDPSPVCAATQPASCVAAGLVAPGETVARSDASASNSNQYEREEVSVAGTSLEQWFSAAAIRTACSAWKVQGASGWRACGEATLDDVIVSVRPLNPPPPAIASIAISNVRVEACVGSAPRVSVGRVTLGSQTFTVGDVPPNLAVPLGPGGFAVIAERSEGGSPCPHAQAAAVRVQLPEGSVAIGWVSVLACA